MLYVHIQMTEKKYKTFHVEHCTQFGVYFKLVCVEPFRRNSVSCPVTELCVSRETQMSDRRGNAHNGFHRSTHENRAILSGRLGSIPISRQWITGPINRPN